MAKPKNRCNGVCSPLVQPASVRACCCDLKPDYDLTNSIKAASEIFYRLTGRQQQYAGVCTHVVYPCIPNACQCECKNFMSIDGYIPYRSQFWCSHELDGCLGKKCNCKLDFVFLPGVCEVERVTVNGEIVDPRVYAVSGERLVRTDGNKWPMCQALGKDASPINQFTSVMAGTISQVTIFRQPSGKFTVRFIPTIAPFDCDVVEFVGDDGWKWSFAVESLTHIIDGIGFVEYEFDPQTEHLSDFADVLSAADGYMVRAVTPKPGQAYNTSFSIENASVVKKTFFARIFEPGSYDDPCNTFEVIYRSGCCVPSEVSDAVGKLACELALASCGAQSCRLPSNLRSMKLDGDMVSAADQFALINDGLTGLPEVDQIIRSINPAKLYRRGRLVSGSTNSRKLHRFK